MKGRAQLRKLEMGKVQSSKLNREYKREKRLKTGRKLAEAKRRWASLSYMLTSVLGHRTPEQA